MPRVAAAGLEIAWETGENITVIRLDRPDLDRSTLWLPLLERLARSRQPKGILFECRGVMRWTAPFVREFTRYYRDHREHLHIAAVGLPPSHRVGLKLYARLFKLRMRAFDEPDEAMRWLREATRAPMLAA